ncbi:hypothetical protein MRX96_047918 [Rhipicephalus microplus]
MSRRGSKSRSAPRSRPSSPSPARSGSRGRSTSRTRSGSSNRPRSNTPSGGKGKSHLTWADRARGNQAQASNSQDSHDPRLTNELKELRRANDSLRKENAQFKQEISRLATEIAEIRKIGAQTAGSSGRHEFVGHGHGGGSPQGGCSEASRAG